MGPWRAVRTRGQASRTKKGRNVGWVRNGRMVSRSVAGGKCEGAGQAFDGFNPRTGLRNGCYRRDSEHRLAPKCPRRDTPRGDRSPPPQGRGKARKLSNSAISIDAPVSAKKGKHLDSEETQEECEQSFATTLGVGGLSLVSEKKSAEDLEAGATANLVCRRRLDHHNRLLAKKVST